GGPGTPRGAGGRGGPLYRSSPERRATDRGPPSARAPRAHRAGHRVGGPRGEAGGATAAVPEVGRNDPCPCGSGRKYKKCHGAGRAGLARSQSESAPARKLFKGALAFGVVFLV